MAIAVTSKQSQSFGSLSGATGQFTLDASYPTGGYTVTPQMFALTTMSDLAATTTSGYMVVYNYTTSKLMVFTSAGGGAGTTGSTTATNSSSVITPNVAQLLTGFTGTTAGTTTTITGGGAVVPLNALAGGTLSDGTDESLIISNSALTATTGTIVTARGLAATITATGDGWQVSGTASAQTQAAHTHSISASGGGFSEVANGTDLSSVICNYILMGY